MQGKLLKDLDRIEAMQQKLRDAQMESRASPIAILQLPREEIGHLLQLVQKSIMKSNINLCPPAPPRNPPKKRKRPKKEEHSDRPKKKEKRVRVPPPPPNTYLCRRCKIPGHWLEDCTAKPSNRPPPSYTCHRCNRPGHWISQCPMKATPRPPPPGYVCHACGMTGHYIKDCPNKGRKSEQNQRTISPSPPRVVCNPIPTKMEEPRFAGPSPSINNMPQGPSTSELDLLEQLLGNDNVSTLFDNLGGL